MTDFIFGGDTGISSPEQLARRRDLIRALRLRSASTTPRNQWEGLNSLVQAIGGRIAESRLDQAEAAGHQDADAQFASYLRSGMNTPPSVDALSNRWMSPTQQDVLKNYFRTLQAAPPKA